MLMQFTTLFLFAAMLALGQTNNVASTNQSSEISDAPAGKIPSQAVLPRAVSQHLAEIRANCIQVVLDGLRQNSSKVLPEGLVVESGYT